MLLTLVILLPLIGSMFLLLVPRERELLIKSLALAVSAATLVLSVALWFNFDPALTGMQFSTRLLWIPGLDVSFFIGIDGLSLLLVLLTIRVQRIIRVEEKVAQAQRHAVTAQRSRVDQRILVRPRM